MLNHQMKALLANSYGQDATTVPTPATLISNASGVHTAPGGNPTPTPTPTSDANNFYLFAAMAA